MNVIACLSGHKVSVLTALLWKREEKGKERKSMRASDVEQEKEPERKGERGLVNWYRKMCVCVCVCVCVWVYLSL